MLNRRWFPSAATAITCLGALLCVGSGVTAALGGSLWAVLVLFVGGSVCDALDGRIARITTSTSYFGAWLDMVCDKVGEAALIIGLSWRTGDLATNRLLALAAVLGLLTSYSKATAVETRALLNWSEVKIIGRTLRVIVLALVVVCLMVTGEAVVPFRLAVALMALLNAALFGWRCARVFYESKRAV